MEFAYVRSFPLVENGIQIESEKKKINDFKAEKLWKQTVERKVIFLVPKFSVVPNLARTKVHFRYKCSRRMVLYACTFPGKTATVVYSNHSSKTTLYHTYTLLMASELT